METQALGSYCTDIMDSKRIILMIRELQDDFWLKGSIILGIDKLCNNKDPGISCTFQQAQELDVEHQRYLKARTSQDGGTPKGVISHNSEKS